MSVPATVRENFETLRVCIIIPTFNNAATLESVIKDVALYTHQIVVVNDGSTDNTLAIVEGFPFVQVISYIKNTSKGWALRKAFA